jgi:hypothetical protein
VLEQEPVDGILNLESVMGRPCAKTQIGILVDVPDRPAHGPPISSGDIKESPQAKEEGKGKGKKMEETGLYRRIPLRPQFGQLVTTGRSPFTWNSVLQFGHESI